MIIGVSGHIGCGKTTFSHYLKDRLKKYGHSSIVYSLGRALKLEVGSKFGIPDYLAISNVTKNLPISTLCSKEGLEKAKKLKLDANVSFRTLLQIYAQKKRSKDEYYWINLAEEEIIKFKEDFVIIDDIRQQNEFNWVKGCAFNMTIRLEEYPNYIPPAGSDHEVEHMLDNEAGFDRIYFPLYGRLASLADSLAFQINQDLTKGIINANHKA